MNCTVVSLKMSPVSLEVDTGADRSILSRSEARRLKVKIRNFSCQKTITGVNGSKIDCRHFCILRLKINTIENQDITINILTYVIDSNVPNLLGSDALHHL